MTETSKMICAGVLFGAWSFAVAIGKAPPSEFIGFIKEALFGLFIHHATLAIQPKG